MFHAAGSMPADPRGDCRLTPWIIGLANCTLVWTWMELMSICHYVCTSTAKLKSCPCWFTDAVCLSVRTGCFPHGTHVRLGNSPDKQYIFVYSAFSLGFICACDTTLMSAVMLYRLTTTGKKEFGSSTAPMTAPAPRPTPIQHVVHKFIEAFLCVGTSFVEAAPPYALMSPESVSNSVKPMLSTATWRRAHRG